MQYLRPLLIFSTGLVSIEYTQNYRFCVHFLGEIYKMLQFATLFKNFKIFVISVAF